MGQGTVNACEGYKMATSKFLPSLVHFVSHVFPGFSALLDRAWFLQPFSGAYPFFFRINRPLPHAVAA